MAGKVLVNLATGLEDAERVTVAFLVATAAVEQGKSVVVWATKDAVRLGLPGVAERFLKRGLHVESVSVQETCSLEGLL